MKFTKLLIFILVIAFTFAGCSYSKPPEKSETTDYVQHTGKFNPSSCQQVTTDLINELNLQNMIKLDKEAIGKRYGFDTECLEDFSAYASSQEGNADEIAVFLISNKKSRKKTLQTMIEKIDEKNNYYKKMNKQEAEKIATNSVTEHNEYIIVTICQSQKLAHDVIDTFYKK